MISRSALVALGCPPALLDLVAQFNALAVARLPGDGLYRPLADSAIIELIDDPYDVLRDGSCYDIGGKLDPEIRDLAARVIIERHPEPFLRWSREVER